jgi:hypothetical protein
MSFRSHTVPSSSIKKNKSCANAACISTFAAAVIAVIYYSQAIIAKVIDLILQPPQEQLTIDGRTRRFLPSYPYSSLPNYTIS